ncbi:MAG: retropepsin-like domain-containing protein [Deltaproteobacteria bacterium]|nr:retropepsin-like domain-containing protein [Deltaproteobacteria bacterium]
MKVTRFDPSASLIIVRARVYGPRRPLVVRLALDTGSDQTLIVPEILDELRYSPRHGEAITVIRSAIGREPGYLLRVSKFVSLGHEVRDFRVHAHDLPEGIGIEGLLGLSFLRLFNYEIRSGEGRIQVTRL